ncbi:MAG: hypothetical protein ACOCYW_07140 [Roseicyclus sp.]
MLRRLVAAGFLAIAAPLPAFAQQLIGEYYTSLTPTDFFNSRGARLTDFGAILQQDRANYHRFGRADDLDQWDPIFADPNLRALIPRIWRSGPGSEYVPGWVLSGKVRYVFVQIFGQNGVPSFIVVHEGAG